jgi:hypothetical protein
MLFQYNGTTPCYACEVRQWLSENYAECLIGHKCEAPVSQPACSPDLNPLDFLLLGYLETKVYNSIFDTREEL